MGLYYCMSILGPLSIHGGQYWTVRHSTLQELFMVHYNDYKQSSSFRLRAFPLNKAYVSGLSGVRGGGNLFVD